jgi:hypothetical protein
MGVWFSRPSPTERPQTHLTILDYYDSEVRADEIDAAIAPVSNRQDDESRTG